MLPCTSSYNNFKESCGYKFELESKKFNAARMFNIDESGITGVQKPEKVLAERGSKVVSKIVNAEKRETTTVVCSMSVSGVFVPSMFLFK